MTEVNFDYETKLETENSTLYITEDAVAENIEMVGTSEVTSNAYCGIRMISEEGGIRDFEVFGRIGDRIIDLVSVDTGKEWEDVKLPTILGATHDTELLDTIANIVIVDN